MTELISKASLAFEQDSQLGGAAIISGGAWDVERPLDGAT
jgi:hypothetical protein